MLLGKLLYIRSPQLESRIITILVRAFVEMGNHDGGNSLNKYYPRIDEAEIRVNKLAERIYRNLAYMWVMI